MNVDLIIPFIKDLFISQRIQNTLLWYILSLMIPIDKHSQAFAQTLSGKDNSLFSNLLSSEVSQSKITLNRAARRKLKKLLQKRKKLVSTAPWTVAIIIDSTLHRRFSKRAQNSQKFNHGKGWVWGHQWTNIGIVINNQYIPLPPIPFYTKEYCKEKGIEYKTEPKKIYDYLRTFSFQNMIEKDEVVVLSDSGYDNKELQKLFLSRGWDFISSLKSSRRISECAVNWSNIKKYFSDGRRRWKTIRLRSCCGKKTWKCYKYKQQVGYLKDVHRKVQLVCSKRSHRKAKFLACSNISVNVKAIINCYQLRWKIENFHRDIKSYLGFEDSSVKSFNSLQNHVHLVYLAYIILLEKYPGSSIRNAQLKLEREGKLKEMKQDKQTLSRIDGKIELKLLYQSAIQYQENLLAA